MNRFKNQENSTSSSKNHWLSVATSGNQWLGIYGPFCFSPTIACFGLKMSEALESLYISVHPYWRQLGSGHARAWRHGCIYFPNLPVHGLPCDYHVACQW